jgi:hypothetical protein
MVFDTTPPADYARALKGEKGTPAARRQLQITRVNPSRKCERDETCGQMSTLGAISFFWWKRIVHNKKSEERKGKEEG